MIPENLDTSKKFSTVDKALLIASSGNRFIFDLLLPKQIIKVDGQPETSLSRALEEYVRLAWDKKRARENGEKVNTQPVDRAWLELIRVGLSR